MILDNLVILDLIWSDLIWLDPTLEEGSKRVFSGHTSTPSSLRNNANRHCGYHVDNTSQIIIIVIIVILKEISAHTNASIVHHFKNKRLWMDVSNAIGLVIYFKFFALISFLLLQSNIIYHNLIIQVLINSKYISTLLNSLSYFIIVYYIIYFHFLQRQYT